MPDAFVSCLCPTFGRGGLRMNLLDEAVQCFLDQDYPADRRELVVLNDTPGQVYVCDAPMVRVVNMDARIGSLGAKRNQLVRLSEGDILLPWDDDDISLPGRVSQAVAKLSDGCGYFEPMQSYWLNGMRLHADHKHGCTHNASAYTRQAWRTVGGYPDESVTEDQAMSRMMRSMCACASPLVNERAWTYVYRWGWSDCHISGGGRPESDWAARGEQKFMSGVYSIRPQYYADTLKALGGLLCAGQ